MPEARGVVGGGRRREQAKNKPAQTWIVLPILQLRRLKGLALTSGGRASWALDTENEGERPTDTVEIYFHVYLGSVYISCFRAPRVNH